MFVTFTFSASVKEFYFRTTVEYVYFPANLILATHEALTIHLIVYNSAWLLYLYRFVIQVREKCRQQDGNKTMEYRVRQCHIATRAILFHNPFGNELYSPME
jgi:hypothetical protein